jgi:rhodanese-related sulfurtransferase
MINLETEVAELFAIQEKIYLRNLSHAFEIKNKDSESLFNEISELLKNMKLPSYHPIILVCQDGSLSEQMGNYLIEKTQAPQKYENIYIVKNGFNGLRQEIELN